MEAEIKPKTARIWQDYADLETKIPDRDYRGRARPGLSWSGGKGYRPEGYFPNRGSENGTQIRGTKTPLFKC